MKPIMSDLYKEIKKEDPWLAKQVLIIPDGFRFEWKGVRYGKESLTKQ